MANSTADGNISYSPRHAGSVAGTCGLLVRDQRRPVHAVPTSGRRANPTDGGKASALGPARIRVALPTIDSGNVAGNVTGGRGPRHNGG
jgi:hypothetical protein